MEERLKNPFVYLDEIWNGKHNVRQRRLLNSLEVGLAPEHELDQREEYLAQLGLEGLSPLAAIQRREQHTRPCV